MITGYNINLDHIKKKLVSVLTVAFAKKWEGGRFFFLGMGMRVGKGQTVGVSKGVLGF